MGWHLAVGPLGSLVFLAQQGFLYYRSTPLFPVYSCTAATTCLSTPARQAAAGLTVSEPTQSCFIKKKSLLKLFWLELELSSTKRALTVCLCCFLFCFVIDAHNSCYAYLDGLISLQGLFLCWRLICYSVHSLVTFFLFDLHRCFMLLQPKVHTVLEFVKSWIPLM